ncbi:hypothetical protein C499_17884 [Halogeometricum borinquense DSM 11551]|uniref:DUF7527 domain-containing protein n=1 Tax=Halogeometricum borinquense (strain ATCC 700274 / DSM 11551 / JCM 10706 / KCTC 4070 / PR3) TaxID=469382 RepID=E4NPK3_HALBP|nr:hypothetical protein [Halogeometricum borinquense]ADQ67673.1 hypothetical protein Hbor_21090 [Halogeometricum borinquense DSM 11551]ELY23646.1 hypothetical protein C499_17884 [Halogeometricum borinquense DSM 11551]
MDSQTIDAVSEWDSVPVESGYEGLHRLADDGFSGAVSTGMTWAFVLNGRFTGVFEGDIEDFEDAELTAYRAPDPALPLLFTMREIGGETRASYYTNKTPLSEADSTLSAGGFTGYVELSENVLSGDYYVVYYGGKSMSAAFVGSSERLLTGDEAFERANDEVGIYEVKEVDVSIVELPEIETDDEPEASAAATETSAEAPDETPTEPSEEASEASAAEVESSSEPSSTDSTAADAAEAASEAESAQSERAADDSSKPESETAEPADTEGDETEPPEADPATTTEPKQDAGAPDGQTAEPTAAAADQSASADQSAAESPDALADPQAGDGDDPFSAEEKWREARSIPSLDPSESSTKNGEANGSVKGGQKQKERPSKRQRKQQRQEARQRRRKEEQQAKRRREAAAAAAAESAEETGESAEAIAKLKDKLEEAEERREKLAEERDELEVERDEYRQRAEELNARVEELESEVERLKTELEASNGGFVAEESLPPEKALSGTNLFVRYQRKGQATLEHARDGEASRQEVIDNLRLEHHTTFDTGGLAVDGVPYEEFLHESTEYAFAKWVVTDLLYEIGETGNRSTLADLFDALPSVDRIELHGVVGFETNEGVDEREFDVIFRDQMGDPLFVADMNTSRNAATQAMVSSLVNNARSVAESDDALATAFYVTESFFEPEALESVAEETSGGFLSRSKKKSFVKLSRKQGYHVCLVEARNNEFHVNVPDL